MSEFFHESSVRLRTVAAYEHQLEMALSTDCTTSYGVKRPSVLNQLPYFHVAKGSLDIAHDLFEGVLPYVMQFVKHFISAGFFSIYTLSMT